MRVLGTRHTSTSSGSLDMAVLAVRCMASSPPPWSVALVDSKGRNSISGMASQDVCVDLAWNAFREGYDVACLELYLHIPQLVARHGMEMLNAVHK